MILVVVGSRETRHVHTPAFVVLANALGEEFAVPGDLEDMIGTPGVLALLFFTQTTPEEWVSILANSDM